MKESGLMYIHVEERERGGERGREGGEREREGGGEGGTEDTGDRVRLNIGKKNWVREAHTTISPDTHTHLDPHCG